MVKVGQGSRSWGGGEAAFSAYIAPRGPGKPLDPSVPGRRSGAEHGRTVLIRRFLGLN